MKSHKIFITGADGFIGSHLVEHLINSGCAVKAFVLYNSFGTWGWLDTLSERIKSNIEIVMGDIRDPHGVKAAMKGCNCVLHLAGHEYLPSQFQYCFLFVQIKYLTIPMC